MIHYIYTISMSLLQNLMMLRQETGMSFEFCHMFINTLLKLVWKYSLKWFIRVIDDSYLIAFICFVLFCAVCQVIVLQDFLVSCSRKDILNAYVTYKMIAIPIYHASQLVYSHDVIDTNDNFHFLDIGEKLPPVLLRIDRLLCWTSISIKTSRLITCS